MSPTEPEPFGTVDTDALGHSFADSFRLAVGQDLTSFFFTTVDDGMAMPIYIVVPLDHNSDSLTDFWMCRGMAYKTARWVLARATPPTSDDNSYHYTFHDSQVGCSAHDELTVLSLHGNHQSLLVVPAFATDPTAQPHPADFPTELDYVTDYTPIPEAERTEYLELRYEVGGGPGQLVATGLPRDLYQRWHDLDCRNSVADAAYGYPLFGAGIGHDKHVDVNGDGLMDILRFELTIGDTSRHLATIQAGLGDGSWRIGMLCEADLLASNGVIRAYVNTGAGFVQGEVVHTFNGNAHANFWLNFVGAQLFDRNTDGLIDLILPSTGQGQGWKALLSQGDGSFVPANVPFPSGWPAYSNDAQWTTMIERFRRTRLLSFRGNAHIPPELMFLGLIDNNLEEWPDLVTFWSLGGNPGFGPEAVAEITNGLGAKVGFQYGMINGSVGIVQGDFPKAPLRTPMMVVRYHREQANPQGNVVTTTYNYSLGQQDVLGRGFLGFGLMQVTTPAGTVRTRHDFTYDADLRDYPRAALPSQQQTTHAVHTASGMPATHVRCEEIQEWQVVTTLLAGGITWLSAPGRRQHDFYRPPIAVHDQPACGDLHTTPYRTITTNDVRDAFGTVVSTTTEVALGDGHDRRVTTTEALDILNNEDAWLIGLPHRLIVRNCPSPISCQQRETTFDYDPTTGAPQMVTSEPGEATLMLTTNYAYDAHGNVREITRTDATGQTRTRSLLWDAEGAFLRRVTNEVGHTAYVVHHTPSGALVAAVQPGGLTTKTDYDGLFRPVRTTRHASPLGPSDGEMVETSYLGGDPTVDDSAMRTQVQVVPHGQTTTLDYGATGQVIRRRWLGMAAADIITSPVSEIEAGDEIFQATTYDARGRVRAVSVPTWSGVEPAGWTNFTYDDLDRILTVTAPNGTVDRYDYDHRSEFSGDFGSNIGVGGTRVQHTDANAQVRWFIVDPHGHTVYTSDAARTETRFRYGAFGTLTAVERNSSFTATGLQAVTTYSYDRLGQLLSESDSAFGTRSYAYNAFGELERSTGANRQPIVYHYDSLGRVTRRSEPAGDSTFSWDTTLIGALGGSMSPDGVQHAYHYDAFGRLQKHATRVQLQHGTPTYTFHYTYGNGGRLRTIRYPQAGNQAALQIRYHYDGADYLRAVTDDSTGQLYWMALSGNPWGQVERERYGNNILTTRMFDAQTALPTSITTQGKGEQLQKLQYTWRPDGELEARHDNLHGQSEMFTYDALYRLRSAAVNGGPPITVEYDVLDNITLKSDIGSYHYNALGQLSSYGDSTPTALTYDANGNVTTHGSQTFTYTAFDQVRTITDGPSTLNFRYDAAGARTVRTVDERSTLTLQGLFELQVNADGPFQVRFRIPNGSGRVVAQLTRPVAGLGGLGILETVYLHDDHLGSTHVASTESGQPQHVLSYDPWGRLRSGTHWGQPAPDPQVLKAVAVGFTGHQPELDADLINMRGRMYDPRLGRFTGADPLVAEPFDAQSYNRYSYVFNHPLRLTDPSGWAPDDDLGDTSGGSDVSDQCRYDSGDDIYYCPGGEVRTVYVAKTNTSEPTFPTQSVPSIEFWYGTSPVRNWSYVSERELLNQMQAKLKSDYEAWEAKARFKAEVEEAEKARQLWVQRFSLAFAFNRLLEGTGENILEYGSMFNPYIAAVDTVLNAIFIELHGPDDPIAKAKMLGDEILSKLPGAKILGVKLPGTSTVLQTGGHIIMKSTAKALNEYFGTNLPPREWGRALERLKKEFELPDNHHGKILNTGDYIEYETGKRISNLEDFLRGATK